MNSASKPRRRQFQAAAAAHRPLDAISAAARAKVDRISELVQWPRRSCDAWRRGFLAGVFDADGSWCRGILRIASTDQAIIEWTAWCLRGFDFDIAIEDRGQPNGPSDIRFRGGLRERLRFFHLVDPAIGRNGSLEGVAVKSAEKLRVAALEPLGLEMPLYDITTGTGDFIANGVISHNCFARPTHRYLDMDAGRDFEREIVVKVNAPEVLGVELAKPSWKREHVALGTNTDPYQWVESRYRLMPEIWAALCDSDTPCSVLTKSPLLLRDVELFQELVERVGFTANLSIPTIDEKAWRASEPHTPSPRARIEGVAALNRAGVPTGVLVAPLMPGINDDPEQVERILELCTDAGATHIGGIALHLRGEVREVFMEWLRSYRPDLVPRYEEIYRRRAYAPSAERERLAALLGRDSRSVTRGRLAPRAKVRESHRDPALVAAGSVESGGPRRCDRGPSPGEPRQGALF